LNMERGSFKKVNDYAWEIPETFRSDMLVPVRFFASEDMLDDIMRDESLYQAVNVATLPGVQKYALVMPDMHEGYGFPIGGVAAMDAKNGVISPGGIGFDINCGVRLLASAVTFQEIQKRVPELATQLFQDIPSGVGRRGPIRLSTKELDGILTRGVGRLVESGHAAADDLTYCEASGCLTGTDPAMVSKHAKGRGRDQLGTMGAGNHFVEIQRIDTIFDESVAKTLGLFKEQICILIHCGSRGLGHQVATDYIKIMLGAMAKYKIEIPDRQLACAPFQSPEGQSYWKAMQAAANFAWANRQMITWETRLAWDKIFGKGEGEKLKLVYDVCHNIAKVEEYGTGAKDANAKMKVMVHRKGATRAFPPHHPETPERYKEIGQPVIIPGSMGTASYVLVGTAGSMTESFGSSCHGAGRMMSRTAAKKKIRGADLKQELEARGISVRSGSMSGLAEEAPFAYKDVEKVVDVVHNTGIAKRVARLRPVGVIKG